MPRTKQSLTPQQLTRLRSAQHAATTAQAELEDVVRDLLEEGASIRELAAAADISTNTVQRWKRGD